MNKVNFWLQTRTIVAYAVSMLALAEIVDLTIVAVAIPHIMGSLNANLSEVSLTMTSYIVAAAVCLPLTGLVTRKYGIKHVILASTLLFGISSVLCGLSTSLTEMVLFRLLQGIGGAFLPSIAQTYISKNFTSAEQPKIMTFYSLCVVLGPIIGPIFGGTLTESLNWRWCFYVNVPICITGFLLIWSFMPKDKAEKLKIDYISFLFLAFGVGCFEYFIDEGNKNNWFDSQEMVIMIVTSCILIGFFIYRGLLGKSVINFVIFRNSNVVLCCISMFIFMSMASASLTYFSTMLQQIYGYPVNTAGYLNAPRGMVAFVAAPIIIKLIGAKLDARIVMMSGMACFALGCFMMSSYSTSLSISYLITSVIIQGMGMMGFFIPIMQIVFIGVSDELHGEVSGIFNFSRNIASSVGTSLSSTIVSHQMQVSYHDLGTKITPYSRGFLWWSQKMPMTPIQGQAALAHFQVLQQSALISYLDSFYCFGLLLLIFCWLPFILKKPVGGKIELGH
jgi:DHA2 family multidrug resistance protein